MNRPSPEQTPLFDPPLATVTELAERRGRKIVALPRIGLPGQLVLEFHSAFGLPVSSMPTTRVAPELIELRQRLLDEELGELRRAIEARSLAAIADGLGDVVYVLYGTALTFGINLDAVLAEIHRSNMSKLDRDGRPIMRDDGKVLKGPDYSPPDVAAALGRGHEPELPLDPGVGPTSASGR